MQPCRGCGAPVSTLVIDLGMMPLANSFRANEDFDKPELFYPLRVLVCDRCKLVQLHDVAGREAHFHENYAYFSSFSSSWVAHARRFVDEAIPRFSLNAESHVVEIASNDGYLLRHLVERGIPCLGIEPAANCAAAAEARGVATLVGFFGVATARALAKVSKTADLIVANNVLAHVPDLDDFIAGLAILLKPGGTIAAEFPHLLRLIEETQFDTIYHEHFSYLSVLALAPLFTRHGLAIVDVARLATHGGSLRLYVRHQSAGPAPDASVERLVIDEREAGLQNIATYLGLAERAKARKRALLKLLIDIKARGRTIAGYGAPAKANTLLNYCGIRTDFLDYTVDRNPAKQGRHLPGTGILVRDPEAIRETRPNYLLILPWNLTDEIMQEWREIGEWGGKFIVPAPTPRIVE